MKLPEEISVSVKDVPEVIKQFEIANKEIERLNKELQDTKEHLGEYLYEQEEENKRLNNIINELEKWLNKKYDEIDKKRLGSNLQEELQICSYLAIYETILKKLQELKGDGSNEKTNS